MSALSQSEFQALAAIARARKENTGNLLRGTRLVWGAYAREKTTFKLLKGAKKVSSQAKKLIKGGPAETVSAAGLEDTGREFVSLCTGLDGFNDAVEAVTSETMSELVSEMTPFLGILRSGYKSASSWRAVIKDGVNMYKSSQAKIDILPGDPRAAVDAIITLLERKLAKDSINAARHSAAFGTKVAGLFADLGTATTAAVGLANATAALVQELALLGVDYSDLKAGNAKLADPAQIDARIFKASPILGCYIIVCSDTSQVLNFFVADIGLPGWMDKVEEMKKNSLDRLVKVSNKFIIKSRIHLEGLPTNKGIQHKKTFASKVKNQFAQLVKSKL